jgi:DNA-binding Xre family transcriptional regulator
MNTLENITHRNILEEILKKKGKNKRTLAIEIGISKTNYTEILNKDFYSEKIIKGICTVLGVEASVFDVMNGEAKERSIDYNDSPNCKELLAAKEETIVSLREQIALLKEMVTDLKGQKK